MRQDDSGRNAVRHFSGPIHCPRRGLPATISAVEREEGILRLRSVLWCSLRGEAQWCSEDCVACLDAAEHLDATPPT